VLNTIASDFSLLAELNPKLGVAEGADVEEVVTESVELWKAANSTVNWVISLEAEAFVHGKKSHLIRVLNNLLSNAVHAVAEVRNAQIEVRVRLISDDSVQIRVRDNGPGIPEIERERIFEPRFTTKSQGTGMGLAMVRAIVRQYGGDVNLVSVDGAGACFEIVLMRVA
jgi:signal transduction histidine kinase